jgi:2-keto-4-pentenoate hydratase/2-oxohepta-3-ene-1,7-dioic acid hydratase in catechol pathway
MRLLTFQPQDGSPRPGILVGDQVVDVQALAAARGEELPGDVLDYISEPTVLERARGLVEAAGENLPQGASRPLVDVTLKAPFRPGKIVGVGLNYTEHVAESARSLDTDQELPTRPVLFSKPSTAVVGPGEPIRHNGNLTSQLDWEVELAVVIGKRAFQVSQDDALDYVAGYTITNDISARDQRRSGQWFYSKGQDSYAPLGPWLVTADEIGDPQALDVELRVNGETKQKANTRYMLFSIRELIADITSGMTLEPGDVIATGSPSGVGAAQNPPQYLQPGDVVELEIEKIGLLSNPVVDAR